MARQPLVRRAVVSTPGVRDLAWRFVAGEDLDAGVVSLRELASRGIRGTLNHVGTHVHDAGEAIASATALVEASRRLASEDLAATLSIKLTQIGLDVDPALCREQLERVMEAAVEGGIFVRIDMEEAPYVERTIALFEAMRDGYGADRVGIVMQSYLRRGADDLRRLVTAGSRVRIVKGGYWEPSDVVYRTKAEIDAAFARDVRFLLEEGTQPAIATHDPAAVAAAIAAAAERGLDASDFEFQMLYGVARPLQERLVGEGFRVRCYVPYGGDWFLYFLGCVRRLPAGLVGGARRRVRVRRRQGPGSTR